MIDIYPTYYLKFPSDTTWTDISPIVDSKQTSITYNGCNKDIKSAIDTADITLMGVDEVGYVELRSYVIACLLAALEDGSTVLAKILRPDGDFYFYGKVDLSNFSIESSRIPGSIRLACDDNSYLLDENIAQSFEWPSKDFPGVNKDGTFVDGAGLPIFVRTGESIVGNLLSMAGYAVPDIIAPDTALVTDRIIDLPYDVDDKKTYRGLMNTLLFEHGSVFSFDRDGKFRVTKLSFENPVATRSVDNYVDADKIKTSTSIYDNDGIKLTWSTLGLMKQGTLYVDNISNNRDDSGEIIGEEVKSGEYYPSTGDIEDVYQSFDAKFLDRPYLTAQSRLQNKDLSLISARNINYEIMPSGKFTLPTVGTLTTNPMLYPTKARFLFYNPTDKAVNIQRFRIAGDSLYRAKNNIYTVPDFSKNPEEYVSTYIYTEDEATTFSNFYRIFKKYGQLSHKWSEIADVPLFEVVAVPHKKTDVHTIAMVISTTLSFAGDKVKSAVSAIGISRYDALPPKKESVTTGSGLSAQDGRPGIDAKVLSLNLSATQFSFNADGAPKEQDDITVSVSQQGIGQAIHLYVNGAEVETEMGRYIIPATKMIGRTYIRVRATCGDEVRENIITKVTDGSDGPTGPTGPQGIPGPAGENGQSLYTWVAYADDASGSGITADPTGKKYVGFAYNKVTASMTLTPSLYTWAKIEGPQGTTGATGATLYTWLKYADTPTSGMSDSPTGKAYIGLAYNKTTPTESNVYSDYTWSLVKGDKGDDARLLRLTCDNPVFRLDKDGMPYPDQKSTLRVEKQGDVGAVKWTMPNHIIPDGTVSYEVSPADMGYSPITMVNNISNSSADWSTVAAGTYNVKRIDYKIKLIPDGRLYFYRCKYKFETTNQSPTWARIFSQGGNYSIMGTGNIYDPNANVEYTLYGVAPASENYGSNFGSIYNGNSDAINGVIGHVKEDICIDLSELVNTYPERLGGMTREQLAEWCNTYIPYIPAGEKWTIGGTLKNLLPTPTSADGFIKGNSVTDYSNDGIIVSGTSTAPISSSSNNWTYKLFDNYSEYVQYQNHYVRVNSITSSNGFRCGIGYSGLNSEETSGLIIPRNTVVYTSYCFSFATSGNPSTVTVDMSKGVLVGNLDTSGWRAQLALYGITTLGDIRAFMDAIPFFTDEMPFPRLSSLPVTVTADALTDSTAISIVQDGKQGTDGQPAIDFSITPSQATYAMTSRTVVKTQQTIVFTCDRQNTTGAVTWNVNRSLTITPSADGITATVVVPIEFGYANFTVTCVVAGVSTKTLTVNGVASGSPEPIFLGKLTTPPTETDEGPLMVGDSYLRTDNIAQRWDGVQWVLAQSSDANYPYIMMNALSQVLTDGSDVNSSMSALYGYIKELVSKSATVENLFSQFITLLSGGAMRSEGYEKGDIDKAEAKQGFFFDSTGYSEWQKLRAREADIKGLFSTSDSNGIILKTQLGKNSDSVSNDPQPRYSVPAILKSLSTASFMSGTLKIDNGQERLIDWQAIGLLRTMLDTTGNQYWCVSSGFISPSTPGTISHTFMIKKAGDICVFYAALSGDGRIEVRVNGSVVHTRQNSSGSVFNKITYVSEPLNMGDEITMVSSYSTGASALTAGVLLFEEPYVSGTFYRHVFPYMDTIPETVVNRNYYEYYSGEYFNWPYEFLSSPHVVMKSQDGTVAVDTDNEKKYLSLGNIYNSLESYDTFQCDESASQIQMAGGTIYAITSIKKTAEGVTLELVGREDPLSYSAPPTATTGWYTIQSCVVTVIGELRGLITDNLIPVGPGTKIGSTETSKRYDIYGNQADIIQLNSQGTTNKVWGAVFN